MNILLQDIKEGAQEARHIVVLFGLGVVGGAIREHLILNDFQIVFAPVMHWGDKESFQEDLRLINNYLTDLSQKEANVTTRLSIVWAAGKAGFSASEEDTVGEWVNYNQTVNMLTSQWAARLPYNASFYFVSSAGGLFEGQQTVGHLSRPSPVRPYGFLKMRQEELLQDMSLPFKRFIYRPSSIYGYIDPAKRMGLIPTLLFNGIRYGVSHIFGDINTLRDYIASADVGDFLCREILSTTPEASERPLFLAAGKPTSILEVKALIERIIGRRLFISYGLEQTNSLDNTFSAGSLPNGWRSVELGVGIRRVYARWCSTQGRETPS